MGRRLSPEAIDALKSQCVMNPDVQVVVSDGLYGCDHRQL